jgi:phosphopantetheine adenylyltransferase
MDKVRRYLQLVQPLLKVDIVPLHDPYGPAVDIPDIGGIVVSTETIPGAVAINDIRENKGLSRLALYVVFRFAADNLSSSHLRKLFADKSSTASV